MNRLHILVVSLHPAIDRTIEVPAGTLRNRGIASQVIRGRLLKVEAAGKGVNIAHTLSNLGQSVSVVGFFGKWDAEMYKASFDSRRVKSNFVMVDCFTRENITLLDRSKELHLISGALEVGRSEINKLAKMVDSCIPSGGYAVFSGSRPDGFSLGDYRRLLRSCRQSGARVVVDASGKMLETALRERPWLIKPNLNELAELTGRRLRGMKDAVNAARTLLPQCPNILVSMGRQGAAYVTHEGTWHAWDSRPPRIPITVGCGDSLLAGFLFAFGRKSEIETLKFAVACGSACACSTYACITRPEGPAEVLRNVRVESLQHACP